MLSDANARLASARRLTSRKERHAAGRFLAEGAPAVTEALRRTDVVLALFATAVALRRHAGLVEIARAAAIPVDEVSERAAASLSETSSPQGLIAICRVVDVSLATVLDRRPRLLAVLVDANEPGNAGTIVRTADAAGAGAVVFAGNSVDPYNGKAVRASAGSMFHLDLVTPAPITDLVPTARAAGYRVLATSGTGSELLDDVDLRGPTMWLFGNEANGLPDDLLAAADARVRIPIYGRAESLNLASAAALCLYASAAAQGSP